MCASGYAHCKLSLNIPTSVPSGYNDVPCWFHGRSNTITAHCSCPSHCVTNKTSSTCSWPGPVPHSSAHRLCRVSADEVCCSINAVPTCAWAPGAYTFTWACCRCRCQASCVTTAVSCQAKPTDPRGGGPSWQRTSAGHTAERYIPACTRTPARSTPKPTAERQHERDCGRQCTCCCTQP
jgi:hypothetical protein